MADRSREAIAGFSKGMLQRLALAQALVNDPQLLVLDEPSEGMDLAARRLLHEVICQRRESGHSVILVSHALADVARLCDRVAVLRAGRVVYIGPHRRSGPKRWGRKSPASNPPSSRCMKEPWHEGFTDFRDDCLAGARHLPAIARTRNLLGACWSSACYRSACA